MVQMQPGDIAYFEGDFVPVGDARLSVMTHAFNYGTALFEGIRGYYNGDVNDVYLFRLQEHVDRFVRNFSILCMEIPEDAARIEEICLEVARKSALREDIYLRPICYKDQLSLGPAVRDVSSSMCCYVIKLGDYVDTNDGLDVAVSSWRRLSDNAIPTRAKTTGSYINSALAATEAKQSGFHEAIFLREDGTVAEGSAMNIFVIQGNDLITPPPNADILVGITRNTIMQLAQEQFGFNVIERPIARTELYISDEIFFCGTGAQVAPIRSVDRRLIGSGEPGEKTRMLQKLYFDVVQGKVEEYRHWCTPVYS